MSRPFVTLLALAVGNLVVAAEPADKGDLSKLKGTWKTLAGPNHDLPVTLKIDGNTATASFKTPEGEELTIKGEVKINDAATPKTIDFVHFKRPNGDDAEDSLGIYELKGDELKVCNGGPGKDRPTEFKEGDEGETPHILVFNREPDPAK